MLARKGTDDSGIFRNAILDLEEKGEKFVIAKRRWGPWRQRIPVVIGAEKFHLTFSHQDGWYFFAACEMLIEFRSGLEIISSVQRGPSALVRLGRV